MRRIEAKKLGEKFYSSGSPCKKGHDSTRYVANGHCVECMSEKAKTDESRSQQKIRRESKKSNQSTYYSDWYSKNKESKLAYMRNYNASIANKRFSTKYKNDDLFNIMQRSRSRICKAFQRNGFSKNGTTEQMIGCSWAELKHHIERQFLKRMSWSNRSEWHIDHITPLSSAKTKDEVIALCHYTNLRPMWADDNRKKSSKKEFLI